MAGIQSASFVRFLRRAMVDVRIGSQCGKVKLLDEDVTIPAGVKTIGEAFYANETLQFVTIGADVKTISAYAFGSCPNLSRVTIEGSVETIAANAFWNCDTLRMISIPKSLKMIGENAFKGCPRISSVEYAGSASAFSKITIEKGNDYFKSAAISYR